MGIFRQTLKTPNKTSTTNIWTRTVPHTFRKKLTTKNCWQLSWRFIFNKGLTLTFSLTNDSFEMDNMFDGVSNYREIVIIFLLVRHKVWWETPIENFLNRKKNEKKWIIISKKGTSLCYLIWNRTWHCTDSISALRKCI